MGWRRGNIAAVIVWALVLVWCQCGCASLAKAPPTISAPAGPPGADQAGLVNAAVQGVTGISIEQALPVGLTLLLGWIVWLSHRREMRRLTRERSR